MPKITEEHRRFLLNGTAQPYVLKRSARRTFAIQLRPDLSIIVRAPKRAKIKDIEDLLRDRHDWITTNLAEIQQQPSPPPPYRWVTGENHYYLGHAYPLMITVGDRPHIQLHNEQFQITVPNPQDIELMQTLMHRWYRTRAKALFRECLAQWVNHSQPILQLDHQPIPIRIRLMKTRWGSCSSRGNINLNLALMRAPLVCIDYVIVHELCHFREMNHSKKFWRLVTDCLPDWQHRKQILRQLEPELLRR
ncbi:MAG: M48 family metallopeptidase [Limnothrix sp. RL_2_0]|nr:M48 family metallopeptidase [Limnothrix sp. RL_2_0]